jgi:hypothetical protein
VRFLKSCSDKLTRQVTLIDYSLMSKNFTLYTPTNEPPSLTFNSLGIHSKSLDFHIAMISHFDNKKSHPSLAASPGKLRQQVFSEALVDAMHAEASVNIRLYHVHANALLALYSMSLESSWMMLRFGGHGSMHSSTLIVTCLS